MLSLIQLQDLLLTMDAQPGSIFQARERLADLRDSRFPLKIDHCDLELLAEFDLMDWREILMERAEEIRAEPERKINGPLWTEYPSLRQLKSDDKEGRE